MSHSCYCSGNGKKCRDCLEFQSHRLYPDKEYPCTCGILSFFGLVLGITAGIVFNVMFAIPVFVATLFLGAGTFDIVDAEDFDKEFDKVAEHNDEMEEARREYVERDSCIII